MDGFEFIASVDCVRTKAKPKERMGGRGGPPTRLGGFFFFKKQKPMHLLGALRAAILSLGFMSLYTWRQLYNNYRAKKLQETT
jgi:hypothetical protein